jgi:hypothetical protein
VAGPVLATVNGSPIYEANLRRAVEDKWGKRVLDDIIKDRLVRQEARARGIKTTGPEWAGEIDAALAHERSQYASEGEFLQMLEEGGYSVAGYRHDLETKLILDHLMAGKSNVTDAEINKYYEEHKSDFVTPGKIHLYDIVTATVEDAYMAKERLAKGDAFATVASEMSSDKDTAQKGGERGYLGRDDITDPVLREAAFSLKDGIISNPIQAGDHFHILYVKDRQPEKAISHAEARQVIVAKLQSQKGVSADDYVASLARKANIKIAWTPLKYMESVYAGMKAIQVIVDGQPLRMAEHPVILPNGTMMVPAKPVLAACHVQMTWNSGASQLIATTQARRVAMTVGSPTATVGETRSPTTPGKPISLPEGPQLRNGHLYIPPRALLEALGGKVEWDAARNAIVVQSPSGAPTVKPAITAPTAAPVGAAPTTDEDEIAPAPTPTPAAGDEGGATPPVQE